MDRNRILILVAAVVAVVIVAGGFLAGVQPQLQAASAATSQRNEVMVQNRARQLELAKLNRQFRDIGSMTSALDALRASVPASAQISSFLKQVNAAAVSTDTVIQSIKTQDPQAYSPPASAAVATTGSGTPAAAPTPTPTPSPSASATPAVVAPIGPQAPALVTDALVTGSNFSFIDVDVSIDGSYDQMLDFVDTLQHGSRMFLVHKVISASQSQDASASPDSWTISGIAYVLENSETAAAPTATDSTTTQAQAAGR